MQAAEQSPKMCVYIYIYMYIYVCIYIYIMVSPTNMAPYRGSLEEDIYLPGTCYVNLLKSNP